MSQSDVVGFVNRRARKFRAESFLPKRKAWLQTLVLLPFGLPLGNFLSASWHFSANAIIEDRQYLLGGISMIINIILPILFLAFVYHWGWFVWQQPDAKTWYPKAPALRSGAYATATIAVSFSVVALFAHSVGICSNSIGGEIGAQLFCSLDGYGFESKSWFGAWFIVAAYCYKSQKSVDTILRRIFHRRHNFRANSLTTPLQENIDAIANNGDALVGSSEE
jgi:hypothetical protein